MVADPDLIPDADPGESRRVTREVGLPGALGFLGQWPASPVIKDYGIEFVWAAFLIVGDGRILVRDCESPQRAWRTRLEDEVAKAIGKDR